VLRIPRILSLAMDCLFVSGASTVAPYFCLYGIYSITFSSKRKNTAFGRRPFYFGYGYMTLRLLCGTLGHASALRDSSQPRYLQYYYLFQTQMHGFWQTTFLLLIAVHLRLLGGTLGHASALRDSSEPSFKTSRWFNGVANKVERSKTVKLMQVDLVWE
jgi:hypothetical protein